VDVRWQKKMKNTQSQKFKAKNLEKNALPGIVVDVQDVVVRCFHTDDIVPDRTDHIVPDRMYIVGDVLGGLEPFSIDY